MTQLTTWGKLLCRLCGEVPADTLEAYRRAGGTVYDLLAQVEQQRLEGRAEGLTPWTVPPSTQAEMLCAWNAFVLQHLGDTFLQADYNSNPATVGYVPPITADQILEFYAQVEGWVSRAQQAYSNPGYRLDVAVPAEMPPWSEVEPCPNTHLHGMLQAMRSVRDHAQAALLFLPDNSTLSDPKQQAQAHYMRQILAAAVSKARYAEDLHGSHPTQEVHERVEPFIKEAIEGFYLLGQMIAMPTLAEPPTEAPAPKAQPRRTPVPPEPKADDFDPWCLTDPNRREHFQSDRKARRAIDDLWRLDPDPAQTLAVQSEIDAAFERGDIDYATTKRGARLGHFFCCPWAPVYVALRSLTLGGQHLRTMQEFVFDVTAEGMNLGEPFRRHIKTGAFQSTTEFEYGDPNEPPDH